MRVFKLATLSIKSNLPMALLLIAWLSSGCRLAQNAWLTSVAEPIHYSRNLDDKFSHKRFRQMANAALDEARAIERAERDDYYCDPFSYDYEQGFIDGFTEYLAAGGTGEPPPLPPRKYWRGKFQNPAGQQQIQDWFNGYRHGVAVAQVGDYRAFVVVPLSDSPVIETQQTTFGRITARGYAVEPKQDDDKPAYTSANRSDGEPLIAAPVPTLSHLPDVSAQISNASRDE